MAFNILFDFERPIAVIVPITVEITVASIAIEIVVHKASIILELLSIFSYHFSENPLQWVSDFLELKEKTTVYTIGI